MFGFILFSAGVLTVGFLFGVMTKAFLDKDEVITLEKENARLHREVGQLKKAAKHEVIEIVDKRVQGVSFPTKEGF